MSHKLYYNVTLDVALIVSELRFGAINISHIPYKKLAEIFKDQITDERYLFDDDKAYFFDKELYEEHKEYLNKEVSFTFDFTLFEYSVSLSSSEKSKRKKAYKAKMPAYFNK